MDRKCITVEFQRKKKTKDSVDFFWSETFHRGEKGEKSCDGASNNQDTVWSSSGLA